MNPIAHPKHPVPKEVAEGFLRYGEQEAAAAEQRSEVARRERPTADERRLRAGLHERLYRSAGVDVDQYRSQSSAAAKQQLDRLQEGARVSLPLGPDLRPMDWEPPEPRSSDPSFWWAESNWFGTPPYAGEFQADGLHFKGKRSYDGGSLIFLHFGVNARFALDANRVPRPERPPWRSAPHVELFGELVGWTGPGGIFEGDRWCKCWMVRRQTLWQWQFGPSGPVQQIIGDGIHTQTIFDAENQGRHLVHRLPGFQPMPSLVLNGIYAGAPIWAELEVRFDIQLEGNSFLWIHPFDVLVRHFQWPLEAL